MNSTLVLCTMSVCTTIYSNVSHRVNSLVSDVTNLQLAAELDISTLNNFFDTVDKTTRNNINTYNREALTYVVLEYLEPLQEKVDKLKGQGKDVSACEGPVPENMAKYGVEAFNNMKPCSEDYFAVWKNVKDSVNECIEKAEHVKNETVKVLTECKSDSSGVACLEEKLLDLSKLSAEVKKCTADVQENGKNALEKASKTALACLRPHTDTLRRELKPIQDHANACLDAL